MSVRIRDQPKHLKPEVLSEQGEAQILRVEAIYDGVENGRRPSIFMKNRQQIKAAIRAATSQNMTGQEALARLGEFYPEADIQASIRRHRKQKLKTRAAAVAAATTAIFAVQNGGIEAAEDARIVPGTVVELEITAPSTASTETSEATSSITTTTTSITQPAPIAAMPQSIQTAATPSTSTTVAGVSHTPFNQRSFGTVGSIIVDEAFSLEVKQIGQVTKDVDVANKTELYQYVDTLAAYNGIDKDTVQVGQRISFQDCPVNGAVIRAGDSAGLFAERNGLDEIKVHELNNGNLQVVAGWCGRVAIG